MTDSTPTPPPSFWDRNSTYFYYAAMLILGAVIGHFSKI